MATKTELFYDAFTSLDTSTIWTPSGTPAPVISGGQLILDASAAAPNYSKVVSKQQYQLKNSYLRMKWVQRPNQSNDTTEFSLKFNVNGGSTGCNFFITSTLFAMRESGAGDTSVAFNPAHVWMGLRHDGTNLIFESSPDGIAWTTRRSIVTSLDYTTGTVAIEAGNYNSAPSPGQAIIEQLNVSPGIAPSLAPTINDTAIITAHGVNGSGGTLSYAIEQKSGPSVTPTLLAPGVWGVVRDQSATLIYNVMTTESPSGLTALTPVNVLPASVGGDQILVRNVSNDAWI